MACAHDGQLPDLAAAQAHICYPPIADALFGDDGFDPSREFLKEPVRKFVDIVMVNTWQRFRKGLTREAARLEALRIEVDELWKSKPLISYLNQANLAPGITTTSVNGTRPSST